MLLPKQRPKCDFCGEGFGCFSNKTRLFNHVFQEHKEEALDAGWKECDLCPTIRMNEHSLSLHLSQSHEIRKVKTKSSSLKDRRTVCHKLPRIESPEVITPRNNTKATETSPVEEDDPVEGVQRKLRKPKKVKTAQFGDTAQNESALLAMPVEVKTQDDEYKADIHNLASNSEQPTNPEYLITDESSIPEEQFAASNIDNQSDFSSETNPGDSSSLPAQNPCRPPIPKEILDEYDLLVETRSEILQNPKQFFFPATGPYLCEICHLIVVTRKGYVNHIGKQHSGFIDRDVFEVMKSRLEDPKPRKRKSDLVVQIEIA